MLTFQYDWCQTRSFLKLILWREEKGYEISLGYYHSKQNSIIQSMCWAFEVNHSFSKIEILRIKDHLPMSENPVCIPIFLDN